MGDAQKLKKAPNDMNERLTLQEYCDRYYIKQSYPEKNTSPRCLMFRNSWLCSKIFTGSLNLSLFGSSRRVDAATVSFQSAVDGSSIGCMGCIFISSFDHLPVVCVRSPLIAYFVCTYMYILNPYIPYGSGHQEGKGSRIPGSLVPIPESLLTDLYQKHTYKHPLHQTSI
mgnify:CR=1 FL=1